MIGDYFLPLDGLDRTSLLADWRWLIGESPYEIHAVAAIGNLFLRDRDGHIHLLEVSDGTFERIADSADAFERSLQDRHNRAAWLYTFLVRELRRVGMLLGPGQCYSRKVPLIVGGQPESGLEEDFEPSDLLVHTSILGQLHRQVRDLPTGSKIDEIRVDPKLLKLLRNRVEPNPGGTFGAS
jgi:hypothetical protein